MEPHAPSASPQPTRENQCGALFAKPRELPRDGFIDRASERHDQVGHALEPLPAPSVELRLLAVAPFAHCDLALVTGEAEREPLLALTAESAEAVRRAVVGREIIGEPEVVRVPLH